jgi:hypothetical protein
MSFQKSRILLAPQAIERWVSSNRAKRKTLRRAEQHKSFRGARYAMAFSNKKHLLSGGMQFFIAVFI